MDYATCPEPGPKKKQKIPDILDVQYFPFCFYRTEGANKGLSVPYWTPGSPSCVALVVGRERPAVITK